jgi:type III pantothenate kinase
LIAVDVGNSNIKLGHFARIKSDSGVVDFKSRPGPPTIPIPTATLDLPIVHATGMFDFEQLAKWCGQHAAPNTHWSVGSVHRSGGALLADTITAWASHLDLDWPVRRLVYQDLPLEVRVGQPGRVGIDRLLAAVAANRLRDPSRGAIVVDLGTAITIDLVESDGGFAGGAILPGIGTAGRALADQTDALPHVALDPNGNPPIPLGENTRMAIEAGLYWGTVGAVNELVAQLSARLDSPPDVFITGGAARIISKSINKRLRIQHVPDLVLAGIALLEVPGRGKKG